MLESRIEKLEGERTFNEIESQLHTLKQRLTLIPGYAGDYCLSHKIAAAAGSQAAKMCYSSSSSVTAGEGFFFFFLVGA